jgi:hypothetical protein
MRLMNLYCTNQMTQVRQVMVLCQEPSERMFMLDMVNCSVY